MHHVGPAHTTEKRHALCNLELHRPYVITQAPSQPLQKSIHLTNVDDHAETPIQPATHERSQPSDDRGPAQTRRPRLSSDPIDHQSPRARPPERNHLPTMPQDMPPKGGYEPVQYKVRAVADARRQRPGAGGKGIWGLGSDEGVMRFDLVIGWIRALKTS